MTNRMSTSPSSRYIIKGLESRLGRLSFSAYVGAIKSKIGKR